MALGSGRMICTRHCQADGERARQVWVRLVVLTLHSTAESFVTLCWGEASGTVTGYDEVKAYRNDRESESAGWLVAPTHACDAARDAHTVAIPLVLR